MGEGILRRKPIESIEGPEADAAQASNGRSACGS
jgi:hypothetical protein